MPNKMERFSQRARRVLSLAQEAAASLDSATIDVVHLLLGLMREDGGSAGRVLRDLGMDLRRLEDLVSHTSAAEEQTTSAQFDLSAGTKKALELAVDEARRLGHDYIGTEHLLLGLVRLKDGAVLDILRQLNVNPEQVRRQVAVVMQARPASTSPPEIPAPLGRPTPSHFDYFLLRTTSRSTGEISQLTVELSAEVKAALEEALKEVGYAGFLRLDERHLLLGLLHKRDGALRRCLEDAELDLDELTRQWRNPDDT